MGRSRNSRKKTAFPPPNKPEPAKQPNLQGQPSLWRGRRPRNDWLSRTRPVLRDRGSRLSRTLNPRRAGAAGCAPRGEAPRVSVLAGYTRVLMIHAPNLNTERGRSERSGFRSKRPRCRP